MQDLTAIVQNTLLDGTKLLILKDLGRITLKLAYLYD